MRLGYDTIAIGAGQAGIAAGRELVARGADHVVLERGRVGETWLTQRWDGFHFNTPRWMSSVADDVELNGGPADGSPPATDFVAHLRAAARDLPVHERTAVTAVTRDDDRWRVEAGGRTLRARSVLLATGGLNVARRPPVRLPCAELHASAYRAPDQLAPGAVLVIGAGQSGCQIAEELAGAGRRVLLCASAVARLPRRHRGRETLAWWRDMGFLDERTEDVEDPAVLTRTQPQISGDGGGHTLGLGRLARLGVELLGTLAGHDGRELLLRDDLDASIRAGDAGSARFRAAIDAYIERAGVAAPPARAEPDRDDEPHGPERAKSAARLDLRATGVTTAIWATGCGGDFSYLRGPALDERGLPRHRGGLAGERLGVLGLPWLRRRASGITHGARGDAAAVIGALLAA
jgi:putative flavoprotein involved in K+ transport